MAGSFSSVALIASETAVGFPKLVGGSGDLSGREPQSRAAHRLIVALSASIEDWMPASVDMVKSSISRLTQPL